METTLNVLNVLSEDRNTIPTPILVRSLCGNLVLHHTIEGNKRRGEGDTYTIAHKRTTFAVCMGILNREDAEYLLDELSQRFDWTFRSHMSRKVWAYGQSREFLDMLNSVPRHGERATMGHSLSYHAWRKHYA
jgi:hypothetical protein